MTYVAGFDFGTSGARVTVIDKAEMIVAQHQVAYSLSGQSDWGSLWLKTLDQLFQHLPIEVRQALDAIAFNGTSATVLLCDAAGQPLTDPLLYNDNCAQAYLPRLAELMPAGSPTLSATSSLVKLLWWRATLAPEVFAQARHLMHQADWLAFQLHGQPGLSDYHNALKLGYDVGCLKYPEALSALEIADLLPEVRAPGTLLGTVSASASERHNIPTNCTVIAGTTDSIAAFLASGANRPGEAVTSLGSTLVIKLLSQTRVDDERYGIYSHRLGNLWLVGGASNTGGNVLKHYFTEAKLQELSLRIPRDRPSGLDYYPLIRPGERFPINDPAFQPRLTPRPTAPEQFLHGLLEGIAQIEAEGYRLLQALGATPPRQIFSAGGGAHNSTWTAIRQNCLSAPVVLAESTEASFGTARLALRGWQEAST
ncbi:MAG: FGGY-family carbohydrate kinase [Leptolyngbyaceae cyanobacterium]